MTEALHSPFDTGPLAGLSRRGVLAAVAMGQFFRVCSSFIYMF